MAGNTYYPLGFFANGVLNLLLFLCWLCVCVCLCDIYKNDGTKETIEPGIYKWCYCTHMCVFIYVYAFSYALPCFRGKQWQFTTQCLIVYDFICGNDCGSVIKWNWHFISEKKSHLLLVSCPPHPPIPESSRHIDPMVRCGVWIGGIRFFRKREEIQRRFSLAYRVWTRRHVLKE